MKKTKKLFILMLFILPVIAFAVGEVDCKNPVGDSAKKTCMECGYVYDGSGKLVKEPDFDKTEDQSEVNTSTEK